MQMQKITDNDIGKVVCIKDIGDYRVVAKQTTTGKYYLINQTHPYKEETLEQNVWITDEVPETRYGFFKCKPEFYIHDDLSDEEKAELLDDLTMVQD